MLKVMVMCHAASHILPDILLRIQLWRVGRQPLDLDLVIMPLQQLLDTFRFMRFVIVNEQNNLALWMSRQIVGSRDGGQQPPEAHIIAPVVDHVHSSSGDGINGTPIPPLCRPHTRCQDGPLLANGGPATGDGWKRAYLGGVSEEENQVRSDLSFQLSDAFFSLRKGQGLAYA
jgi:hypothetical protein